MSESHKDKQGALCFNGSRKKKMGLKIGGERKIFLENRKEPKVSVGIPIYSNSDGLRNTLNLITNQTYKNLEIIISNNNSPKEEIEEIVKEFMKKDKRIKYFKQKRNIGGMNNYKFVFDQSTAEYFMFAASDDSWSKTFIEKCMEGFMRDNSLGLVFPKYKVMSDKNKFFENYHPIINYNLFSDMNKIDILSLFILMENTSHKTILLWGGVWKRDLLKKSFENFLNFYLEKEKQRIEKEGIDEPWATYVLTQAHFCQIPEKLFFKKHKNFAPGSLKSIIKGIRIKMSNIILNLFNLHKTFKYYKNVYDFSNKDIELIRDALNKGGIKSKRLETILSIKKSLMIFPLEIRIFFNKFLVGVLFLYLKLLKK